MVDHKITNTFIHDNKFIKGIPVKYTYGHKYQTNYKLILQLIVKKQMLDHTQFFFAHGGTLHNKLL